MGSIAYDMIFLELISEKVIKAMKSLQARADVYKKGLSANNQYFKMKTLLTEQILNETQQRNENVDSIKTLLVKIKVFRIFYCALCKNK